MSGESDDNECDSCDYSLRQSYNFVDHSSLKDIYNFCVPSILVFIRLFCIPNLVEDKRD